VVVPPGIAHPSSVVGADAMLRAVDDSIAGLKARIAGLDAESTPAGYIGPKTSFVFHPESTAFLFNAAQFSPAIDQLVNYIVRSGTTYQFPLSIGGDGIFLAHSFRIVVTQRLFVGTVGIKTAAQAPMTVSLNPSLGRSSTPKFSLFPTTPGSSVVGKIPPVINYRWNIQNLSTGDQYSDNLIPALAILNRNNLLSDDDSLFTMDDGDWHEFEVPWRFDKAENINVLWRPLTDVIQYDSSISGATIGLPYDDRINGIRDQSVTVQLEFQGERIGGGR